MRGPERSSEITGRLDSGGPGLYAGTVLRWLFGGGVGVALGFAVSACTGPSCNREIAAMRATLGEVPVDAYFVHAIEVGGATPLPTVEEPEAVTQRVRFAAPVVRVHRDGTLELMGSRPETIDPERLLERLPELMRRSDERALYLAFDPDAAIGPHQDWLLAVETALLRMRSYPADTPLRVLVRVPTTRPGTRTGDAAAARRGTPAEDAARLAALADEVRVVSANCEPLAQSFAALASVSPHRNQVSLTSELIDRAEACGCAKVDIAALTALIGFMLSGDDAGLRWLPLDFDGKSGVGPGRGATARDLVEVMVAYPGQGMSYW